MPRPPPSDPKLRTDRAKGALLGLGVGDAFGATLELRRLATPPFPTLLTGPHTEMTGGGPFKVKPGQGTDDSQTAACIAWSLRQLRTYNADDVAKKYTEWLPNAFDVGVQAKAILEAIKQGTSRETAARTHWMKTGRKNAGNGSLVRTAPVGVFFADDDNARARATLEDSAITHFDPRCQLACVALNGAIASAIRQPTATKPETMVDGARSSLAIASPVLSRSAAEFMREIKDAVELVKADLEAAQKPDPWLYGPELHMHTMDSFVRVTFRIAFWELFHAPSFEAGLIDVVNRGGDSDANGAVTGALLGARFGAKAIPERWQKAMLGALGEGRGGPLWDVYHPRHLLQILDS
ncbi:MAG: ADP-ribosylglycohydrolase family protein [Myxococcaceae bacterium]